MNKKPINKIYSTRPVTQEEERILDEIIKEDGEALSNLRAKCNWEQQSLFAIIRNYGDPRNWNK